MNLEANLMHSIRLLFISLTAFLTMISAVAVNAQPTCRELFRSQGSSLVAPAQAKSGQIVDSRVLIAQSPLLPHLLSSIKTWKTELALALRGRDPRKYFGIKDQISAYASYLIRNHKNQEFFFLASQVEIPINRENFEIHDIFIRYGHYLLEDAILAKNYEVFDALETLTRVYRYSEDKVPMIGKWTQNLSRTVLEDARLSRDILTIRSVSGEPFRAKVAFYGRLSTQTLETLKDIERSRDLNALALVLTDLFPDGGVNGIISEKGKKTNATLYIDARRKEKDVDDPFLHITILDPTKLVQGFFRRYYSVESKFNLQLYKYVPKPGDKRNLELGTNIPIPPKKFNWISQMTTTKDMVRILLERDEAGKYYDRGTRFQELVLHRDPDSGRVTKLEIRNGDNLIFRRWWVSQTLEIPNLTNGASRVSIAGEEDLFREEIRN